MNAAQLSGRVRRLVSGPRVFFMAACVALAGCAGSPLFPGMGATQSLFKDRALSAQQASEQIIPGFTTQAEVLALLGSATIIHFDSGQAVWVYRVTRAGAAVPGAEFVILFAPSGVVKKTRLRSSNGY